MGGNFPLELSGSIRWERREKGGKEKERKEKERKEKKDEGKMSEKLHILFKIYGGWDVGFCRSKRQSSFT